MYYYFFIFIIQILTNNFWTKNKDLIEILIELLGVVLTILGWVTVFLLGLKQQKKQLQDSAKMKVYEELYSLKKDFDEIKTDVYLLFSPVCLPFLNMHLVDNIYVQMGGSTKAFEIWQAYQSKLIEKTSAFTTAYIKLWNHSDMWIGAMPEIKIAKEVLFHQFADLDKKIYAYLSYLIALPIGNSDWKTWDQKEIELKAKEIQEEFDIVAECYLDDYMGLIHNFLLAPIFGYDKKPRENFKNLDKLKSYKILTRKGLKV